MPPKRRPNFLSAVSRYAPYALKAYKAYKSTYGRTQQTRKKNYRSGGGVTIQHDRAVQYLRKRAPKKIRRKCKRQRKSHEWNLIKDLGSNTAVRNSVITGSWVAGDTNQYAVDACLYGMRGDADGANNAGFQDVITILNADTEADSQFEKVIFSTGILDITYTNTSTVQFTQEVDVYEIIFTGRNSGARVVADYNEAFAATPIQGGGGTAVANFTPRGITPFECPLASERGYKILKKTKYFVSAGTCFTYQIKDKKNKWLHGHMLRNASSAFEAQWRYKTRNLLFIAKPITGTPTGNAGSFSIGCTRKYLYKTQFDNRDATITI